MRLVERTLTQLEIAPRISQTGALGSRRQAFSDEHIAVRGSVLPLKGRMDVQRSGLKALDRRRVLVPADTPVHAGDALVIGGEYFTVVNIERWQGHKELDCEAEA